MRKFTKSLVAIMFITTFSCHLFAADGIVTFVRGKVNVKKNNNWVALNVGDTISQDDMINTGFQSEAKVKLMDNLLYIGPVTRVSLNKLATNSDTDKINIYLTTGNVRSKVNRRETRKVSYTVTTPIAVASVRGTDFSVNGDSSVFCSEGKVAVLPLSQLQEFFELQVKNEDKTKNIEDGLSAMEAIEDAADLDDIGEVITANMGIQFSTPTATTGAKYDIEQRAEDLLTKVLTESSKPSNDGEISSPNSALNNIVTQPSGSIYINPDSLMLGNLNLSITIPND